MIAAIAEAFGGVNGDMAMQQSVFDAVNSHIGALGLRVANGRTVQAAYLNYLFFNKGMVFQKGGFASINSAANGNNEKLSLGNLTIDEPGYNYGGCNKDF